MVMMGLGDFRFSVDTASYDKLNKKLALRWAKNEPIGAGQNLQFLGQGENSMTLNGVLFPYYKGGLEQIDAMEKMATDGKPLLLADDSKAHEYWVIEEITQTHSQFIGNAAQKIEFTMRLLYYGADLQNKG